MKRTNSPSIGNGGRSEYLLARFSIRSTAKSTELRITICCPKTVRCRMSAGIVSLIVLVWRMRRAYFYTALPFSCRIAMV